MSAAGESRSNLVGEPASVEELADQDDLQSALTGLSLLVSGSQPLEVLLTRVAELAVRAIPGADGAGVSMYDNGSPSTIVASAPFVRHVDDIQYRLVEGPCISAAAQGCIVRSGSLGGERRWTRFGPRVGRLGVHSALSLPLLVENDVIGAINVYAYAKDAFGDHAEQLGELFCASAAVAVHNAKVLAEAQQLATQLRAALISRGVIDQAVGIIMSRSGGTAAEAFATLRTVSNTEHTKVSVVAQRLVDQAARRARVRRSQDDQRADQ